jgi:hypothetical protein
LPFWLQIRVSRVAGARDDPGDELVLAKPAGVELVGVDAVGRLADLDVPGKAV